MPAALEAIPPKPKIAAMMAITKKVTDQRNIIINLRLENDAVYTQHKKNHTRICHICISISS